MNRQWHKVAALLAILALCIADAQAKPPFRDENGDRVKGGDRGESGDRGKGGDRGEGGDRGDRGEGGQRGGPPGGGFGGGRPDPEQIWQYVGRGRDSIDLNDPANSRTKDMITRMGGEVPRDGILRKSDFVANMEKRMAERDSGASTSSSSGDSGPSSSGSSSSSSSDMDEKTKRTFDYFLEKYDKNKDGKISAEEASDRMKPEFAKYDKNRDGNIDKDELRVYIEQFTSGGSSSSGSNSRDSDKKNDDKKKGEIVRPTVIRYGKLPKGVPTYFTELDKDKDGQIGLYEWRRAGKDTSEFVSMDLNKDGYLTAEEWMRFSVLLAEERE